MRSYHGWYKLLNPDKFIKQLDEHMKSYKNGHIYYRSSLELRAFKYADINKHIVNFSIEPFPINYLKPSDGKQHRYYIDLFLVFSTGDKFLVEIKPKAETIEPKKPKAKTSKSLYRYQQAMLTYVINQAKWQAARVFAAENNMKFIIITDEDLGA